MQRRDAEFTEYVAARRTHLRRTAYLMCGDWHTADDLVQTALAKLYVAWPRIHRDVPPDAYVRRILVRANIDESRRPWRRERATEELPESPAEETFAVEDREQVRAALARLAPGQRTAVVLRYWAGLSVEEVARDMECSIGTVKSQTARAIARLRDQLSALEPTPRRES
ncbi:MAG: SigE family RNA polymerase sigma factor [Propionibacteriales bacterium]|nr:SigE family RNA polymerase sigma factor [Propionibacteriales bacterium]